MNYAAAIVASPRTHSFATAGALADDDAIKTSIATAETAQAYSGATLNGAAANPGPAVLDPPRFASVTTSTSGATYNTTDPIVVTGTYAGAVVTESLALTAAGGNETIVGNQPMDTITAIAVPAQLGTGGTLKFGLSGVACRKSNGFVRPFRAVRAIGAGNVKVGYAGGFTDTLALADGEQDIVAATRIYATGTTAGVRLYE